MSDTNPRLEPCPKCDQRAGLIDTTADGLFFVICWQCKHRTAVYPNDSDSIFAWNRHAFTELQEQLANAIERAETAERERDGYEALLKETETLSLWSGAEMFQFIKPVGKWTTDLHKGAIYDSPLEAFAAYKTKEANDA